MWNENMTKFRAKFLSSVSAELASALALTLLTISGSAHADRVQGFDRFKFGMTVDEIRTVGPGCQSMLWKSPNSISAWCKGIRTPSGGPEFFLDANSKRLNGIRIDIAGPATEGDARDLLSTLNKKYIKSYNLSESDIPAYFSDRRSDVIPIGAWQDYGVVLFAYRYGPARQYVGIYAMYYSDSAAERIKQRLAPLIRERSGGGIDASKY
ncbi:unnamed protein product [Enterobius vermicularis]|jgi:hypothetical protein|uniref:Transcriptional regulator n=2 Tax=cellular organisms TaxID=131567 RepID=A0A0N4UU19_ENTVE|nr:unnamed protein product [Enterobius vermicularis]